MARNPVPERHSERGVVFIQVAIAILVLVGFMTFVLDYGVMWLSRGQAQNAADAGALSGALARAFDDFADPPVGGGVADLSARSAAVANEVWNVAPTVNITWPCPVGVVGRCVRADVFRNGEFGSASPPQVFGMALPGLLSTSQGVKATATARVAIGNTTNCMRPFSVADKWTELSVPPNDTFDHWVSSGGSAVSVVPPLGPDSYTPTGWAVPADIGALLVLKKGNPSNDSDPILTGGWFLPVRLPDGSGGYMSGGDDFREAIAMCIGNPVSIGDYLPLESGVMVGPTNQGVTDLLALDPSATYNSTLMTIQGSCAPGCAPFSPRIVPISVFDVEDFNYRRAEGDWSVCPGGGKCIKVVNILGFFVVSESSGEVTGRLMMLPGEFINGAPSVGESNAFLKVIQLVR